MGDRTWNAGDLNEWHKAMTNKHGVVIPKLSCADGYAVSVQASRSHYCEPRDDGAWPYHRFELGYPTAEDEEIATYAEDADRLKRTVYSFVPVENVLLVIAKHGGPSDEAIKEAGLDAPEHQHEPATDRDNLQELAIFHYGTDAQREDQRQRFGLNDYETAAAIEDIAKTALSSTPSQET